MTSHPVGEYEVDIPDELVWKAFDGPTKRIIRLDWVSTGEFAIADAEETGDPWTHHLYLYVRPEYLDPILKVLDEPLRARSPFEADYRVEYEGRGLIMGWCEFSVYKTRNYLTLQSRSSSFVGDHPSFQADHLSLTYGDFRELVGVMKGYKGGAGPFLPSRKK